MNLKQREIRMLHANQIRQRALHDAQRLREALDLILRKAEGPPRKGVLGEIAYIARNALVDATPPDPDFIPGDEWDRI
ncbi:hypothetical protein PQR34_45405 [Paraburkholderia sediminicola]|uniref:hypothetical protein n=1 Tax=Paraburkholderia sediminicola TaxID=458836 RepID=UPI0038B6E807